MGAASTLANRQKKGSAGETRLGNAHTLAGAQKRGRLAYACWAPKELWPTAKNRSFLNLLPQRYELCFGQLLSNRRAVIQPAIDSLQPRGDHGHLPRLPAIKSGGLLDLLFGRVTQSNAARQREVHKRVCQRHNALPVAAFSIVWRCPDLAAVHSTGARHGLITGLLQQRLKQRGLKLLVLMRPFFQQLGRVRDLLLLLYCSLRVVSYADFVFSNHFPAP